MVSIGLTTLMSATTKCLHKRQFDCDTMHASLCSHGESIDPCCSDSPGCMHVTEGPRFLEEAKVAIPRTPA